MRNFIRLLALLVLFLSSDITYGCDLCAIHNASDSKKFTESKFNLGIAEQFTEIRTLQNNGKKVDNEMHQHLVSSITQFMAAYDFSDRFSLQTTIPFINRKFKRVEGEEIQTGTEAGIGDAALEGFFSTVGLMGIGENTCI